MSKVRDLTGQKFGRLTVLKRYGHTKDKRITWFCQCDCGNKKIIVGKNLTNGNTKSCGCLKGVPDGFWENPENRRHYMEQLGEKLNFQTLEDWYQITVKDFNHNKGSTLLHYYQDSPSAAVMGCFPEYDWKKWLFNQVPINFWKNIKDRHRYMMWLGEQLGFEPPEDWYRITQKDFSSNSGRGFLANYYQDSPTNAVKDYFPNYDWKEWLFGMTPLNFWGKPDNRRRYMKWIGEKLDFKTPKDWYKITQKDFLRHKGGGFLNYYQYSPTNAIKDYFPNYDWKEWLFASAPKNFWENIKNRHRYMAWLGAQFGFRQPEDWYRITQKDFLKNKGHTLLKYYQNSPSAAVMDCLPEYDWKEWLFTCAPQHFWDDRKNHYRYMQWLGEQLGFKKPEDWYRITTKDFLKNKGSRLLCYYRGSPSLVVMTCFPDYKLDPEKFALRKKRQQQLYRIVKRIFSGYEVKWDFKHPTLRFVDSGRSMELDIFIPALQLDVEYQGELHVKSIEVWGGLPALQKCQKRDAEKRAACKQHGILFIEVPHTWNGREQTALELIEKEFMRQLSDRVVGLERIQAALNALNTYRKKKQCKQRKRKSKQQQLFGKNSAREN